MSSVGLNLYGGLLTESRRVDLQREVRGLGGRRRLKGGAQEGGHCLTLTLPRLPACPPAWPAANGPREDAPGAAEDGHSGLTRVYMRATMARTLPLYAVMQTGQGRASADCALR